MKKFLPIFAAITLIFCSLFSFQNYAKAISEDQKAVISEYCGTIKQSLKTIQYYDTDNRIKLGAKYESALSKFIIPMNLRIVKNNLSVSEFASFQKTFADYKTSFASDFTVYSKSLEELLAIDCQNNPEQFYQKLSTTREARKAVRQDVLQLNGILYGYRDMVKNLGEKHE